MARLVLSGLLLFLAVQPARADKSADLLARLQRADDASTLYAPALKPWHLKVTFTLYDEKGQNPHPATLEEWWAAPDQDRITYASADSNGTRVKTPQGDFQTPGMAAPPYVVDKLHDAIVYPMGSRDHLDHTYPLAVDVKLGKVKLDCIMAAGTSHNSDLDAGDAPTYCFTPQTDELRVAFSRKVQYLLRNTMGHFQGQSVAVAANLLEGKNQLGDAKVLTLEEMPATSMDFAVTGLEKSDIIHASSQIGLGKPLHTEDLVYPKAFLQKHISGYALAAIIVGKDGHVEQVTPLFSSDPAFLESALHWLHQAVYKPYLVNGQPMKLQAEFELQFKFR